MIEAGRNIIRSRIPVLLAKKRRDTEPPLLLSAEQRDEAYRLGVRATAHDYMVVALAAKFAMADGLINASEIHAFRELFNVPGLDSKKIEPLLVEAGHDRVRFEHYARRMLALFQNNRALYRDFVSKLFQLAVADGPLNSEEILYLKRISDIFGLTQAFFTQRLRHYMLPPAGTPYEVLGVKKGASEEALKKAYYKAVQACHPDKLSFLDSPEEIIRLANQRLTIISEAYSAIKRQRKHAPSKS